MSSPTALLLHRSRAEVTRKNYSPFVSRPRVLTSGAVVAGRVKIQSHHDIGIIAPPAGSAPKDYAIGFLLHFQLRVLSHDQRASPKQMKH